MGCTPSDDSAEATAFAARLKALSEIGASPAPPPEPLEAAAGLGVLRAVSVGEGRSVAVKPLSFTWSTHARQQPHVGVL